MTLKRHHQQGSTASVALYSDCEAYRYALTRTWADAGSRILFIMLNPSTATEVQNDPTVERCERRARVLGFAAFTVTNIFAYRATDPRDMRKAVDPVGPQNDAAILDATKTADKIICAWGTHGEYLNRGADIEGLLRVQSKNLYHLGLSKAGHPKHPLYIGYAVQPRIWMG